MANIMSMKSVRNRPTRSGYDLSRRTCFTAKVGELLPVWWNYVLPFDNYEIDLSSFARTLPVNTASFGRIVEYYDFFFVPLDQLWNRASTTMTQMLNNVQHASSLESLTTLDGSHPHLTSIKAFNDIMDALDGQSGSMSQNMFGFKRSNLATKLMSYLGYGQPNFEHYYTTDSKPSTFGNRLFYQSQLATSLPNVCVYPLLAYQKIYADFFRYTQWERSNPSTFNVDWMTGNGDTELKSSQFADFSGYTMFDLRYCNYQKDLFHGVLPNAQYGDTAQLSVDGNKNESTFTYRYSTSSSPGASGPTGAAGFTTKTGGSGELILQATGSSTQLPYLSLKNISVEQVGQFSILALRQAEALQKWKEISQAAEEDYKQQIQAHWGQPVSDFLSGMCTYLGGHSSTVSVNEVVNTNLVQGETDQPAELAGKGINSVNGKISFTSNGQYGVIMCIYHALPLLDYITSGTDMKLLHVESSSFPIPEMDSIGMELLPEAAFLNNGYYAGVVSPADSLGYVPRYIDWKTDYDRCVGDFANTYQSWILPYSDANSQRYITGPVEDTNPNVTGRPSSFAFFKVNPSIVDPMFAASMTDEFDTDPLRCQLFVKAYCSRLLDPNGLPY